MTQQSEQALNTIKRIVDVSVMKGGIFGSIEGVIDAANAYNYIANICEQYDRITSVRPEPTDTSTKSMETSVNHN